MDNDVELLADVPLFSLLDDDERATLARSMSVKRDQAGDVLFERGDPGGVLFVVRKGRVRMTLDSHVGDTIVLGENTAGDIFGEISLFDGGARSASAQVVEDTELLALKRDDMVAFLHAKPGAAIDLLAVMGRRLRASDELLRRSISRNLNEECVEKMTFGERIADHVARFGGSWWFILISGAVLTTWVLANAILLAERPFDPYPFILLNLVLSMIAAMQAPVIMMSQNRQSTKDRIKADLDYEINLKAELEIAQLHGKVDRLYETLMAHLSPREREAATRHTTPHPGLDALDTARSV